MATRVKYERSEMRSTTRGHETTRPRGTSREVNDERSRRSRPRKKKEVKMAKHGCMGEFFPEREQWNTYVERLKNYFVANDSGGEVKKRAILLSICGVTTYQ